MIYILFYSQLDKANQISYKHDIFSIYLSTYLLHDPLPGD